MSARISRVSRVYLGRTSQVSRTLEVLPRYGFTRPEVIEVLVRTHEARPPHASTRTRPRADGCRIR